MPDEVVRMHKHCAEDMLAKANAWDVFTSQIPHRAMNITPLVELMEDCLNAERKRMQEHPLKAHEIYDPEAWPAPLTDEQLAFSLLKMIAANDSGGVWHVNSINGHIYIESQFHPTELTQDELDFFERMKDWQLNHDGS